MQKKKLIPLSLGFIGIVASAAEKPLTIVITAGRHPEPIAETLPATRLISRQDIERSQAKDVSELIRQHVGVEIGRNGGPGQQTSVFIRGAESNHTLVMLDGIPINPGTIGNAAIQNIHPSQIERIEIVKGPGSTLYGSSAIGGVINIITRQNNADQGTRTRLSLSTGSDETRNTSAGFDHNNGTTSFGMDVSHLSTKGFPTRQESDLDRGHHSTAVNLFAETQFGQSSLGLRHWQSEGETEYFDFLLSPLDQNFSNKVTALTLVTDINPNWNSQIRVSRLVDEIEQNQSPDFLETHRMSLDWQNSYQFDDTQLITAGLTSTRESTESLSFGMSYDEDINIHEIFLQDDIQMDKHRFILGGRYTDHEIVGHATTWNASWEYQLSTATRYTASVGTAFRAPDSTDLYGFGGNPDLDPERSTSYELGLRHQLNRHQQVTLNFFHTRIKDLIQFKDPDGFLGPLPGQNINTDRARISGIELGYHYKKGPWNLAIDALLQDPEDPDTKRTLARRAKKSLTVSLDYTASHWDARIELLATGRRNDSAFNTTEMAGYGATNLSARWHLSKSLRVEGRVLNLFDKEYELASGYNVQDRAIYLGLSWNADFN